MCTNDRRRRRQVVKRLGESARPPISWTLAGLRRPARPRGFTTYLELPNITSQDTLAKFNAAGRDYDTFGMCVVVCLYTHIHTRAQAYVRDTAKEIFSTNYR